jgi:hypothetical protein
MLAFCTTFLLLWQFGAFAAPQPTIQEPRQVAGVPQFVLDYGMASVALFADETTD